MYGNMKHWMIECLSRLNVPHKWFKARRDFKVGDIAMVLSTDIAHEEWELVRSFEIFPCKDG